MNSTWIKRLFGAKTICAGLALALIAGLLVTFAGQAIAAPKAKRARTAGCVAVLAGANRVDTALGQLVADGTLTQTQADAVKTKLGKDATKGEKACVGAALLKQAGVGAALQKLLGMTPKQIRADYNHGQSLTEIAASKNVDRATLVTTITTAINGEIDKLVASGKLTADRAATVKTAVAAKVDKAVDMHKSARKGGVATPAAMATPAV